MLSVLLANMALNGGWNATSCMLALIVAGGHCWLILVLWGISQGDVHFTIGKLVGLQGEDEMETTKHISSYIEHQQMQMALLSSTVCIPPLPMDMLNGHGLNELLFAV